MGEKRIMCPACGGNDLEVRACMWAKLTDAEHASACTIVDEILDWDQNSPAHCQNCGWQGTAGQAIVTDPPDGCLLVNRGKEV